MAEAKRARTTKMSCAITKDRVAQLKAFIDMCAARPEILRYSEMRFFKDYIESLGGRIPNRPPKRFQFPTLKKVPSSTCKTIAIHPNKIIGMSAAARKFNLMNSKEGEKRYTIQEILNATTANMLWLNEESSDESDPDLDTEIYVQSEEINEEQQLMGDQSKEVSEEDAERADKKRIEAMSQLGEGNAKKAIELFREAIIMNPHSALLFAKRGQAFLKLNKVNACIKDCTRALELNCDSAAAYKFRGRAYRLLGEWEKAAQDLRQAVMIDYDEQSDNWLREVQPNAHKIELRRMKQERKALLLEEKQLWQREILAMGAREALRTPGLLPSMRDIYQLMQDPEVLGFLQDPDMTPIFDSITVSSTWDKYESDPKFQYTLKRLMEKASAEGMSQRKLYLDLLPLLNYDKPGTSSKDDA